MPESSAAQASGHAEIIADVYTGAGILPRGSGACAATARDVLLERAAAMDLRALRGQHACEPEARRLALELCAADTAGASHRGPRPESLTSPELCRQHVRVEWILYVRARRQAPGLPPLPTGGGGPGARAQAITRA